MVGMGLTGMALGGGNGSSGPALNYDFLQEVFPTGLSFSRGTGATQFDSTGTLIYSPENIFKYSQDMTNAVWSKSNTTVTASGINTPFPNTTAYYLLSASTSNPFTYQYVTDFNPAGFYTLSICLKGDTARYVVLAIQQTGSSLLTFDTQTGSFPSVLGGATGTSTNLGDGWWNVNVRFGQIGGTLPFIFLKPSADGTTSSSGVGLGFYATRAQASRGTRIWPYVATTASAYYGPRFDYDPVPVYDQQNLLQYSEQLDNAYWSKSTGLTVSANSVIAPDGTMTADTLISSIQYNGIRPVSFTYIVGQIYTVSFWARRDSGSNTLHVWDNSSPQQVIGMFSPTSTWTRYSFTWTARTTAPQDVVFIQDRNPSGFGSIYVWGMQLEMNSSARAYVKTGANASTGNQYKGQNMLRNSTMQGASLGILPNNWIFSTGGGITGAVVNTGIENGLNYIDLRLYGTATATSASGYGILFESGTQIPASNNQAWVGSVYTKFISGNQTSLNLYLTSRQAGGSLLSFYTQQLPQTSAITRSSCSVLTFNNSLVTNVTLGITLPIINGNVYDCTIRIYAPQLEQNQYASDFAPTSGTAAAGQLIYDIKGLLIEESRINLVTYSQTLSDASWTKAFTTVSTDTTLAPNGVAAEKIIANTSSADHTVNKAITTTAGTVTLSCYAKAGGYTTFGLGTIGMGTGYSYFNLSTGTVISQIASHTASIVPVGNGWYRCSVTGSVSTSLAIYLLTTSVAGTSTSVGDGTSGVYVWGVQAEQGAFATSYIPTSSAAMLRNVDYVVTSNLNFFNPAEGTLFAEVRPQVPGNGSQILMGLGSGSTNGFTLRQNTLNVFGMFRNNALSGAGDTNGVTYLLNKPARYALSYRDGSPVKFYHATGMVIGPLNYLRSHSTGWQICGIGCFGESPANGLYNGHILRIKYWTRQISELQFASN